MRSPQGTLCIETLCSACFITTAGCLCLHYVSHLQSMASNGQDVARNTPRGRAEVRLVFSTFQRSPSLALITRACLAEVAVDFSMWTDGRFLQMDRV